MHRVSGMGLVLLLAAAWAMPGPVVGLGLKEDINRLMDAEEWTGNRLGLQGPGPLRVSLYDRPSPLPTLWATLLRFFPCAVAVLWPVLRLVPADLRDAARVDGAGRATNYGRSSHRARRGLLRAGLAGRSRCRWAS